MNIEKLVELSECIKRIMRAQSQLDRYNTVSFDMNATAKRRHNAMEDAREAAIEIRHWKHEAHCLAVELGIADRRSDEHYQDSTAPSGFGRERIFNKRAPVRV